MMMMMSVVVLIVVTSLYSVRYPYPFRILPDPVIIVTSRHL
jgi:hypothetical protein